MTTWTRLLNGADNTVNAMWLMQDGAILVCLASDDATLKFLRPDDAGSYIDGVWAEAGNFLLAKDDFASAVLSDGRLVTCGGEHSGPGLPQNETNFCEIYDPVSGRSTQFAAPAGWTSIGDSPSVVLADGRFLLGNTQGWGWQLALLDATTLTWSLLGTPGEPAGDDQNEEGYVLLQTGDVLTADVYDQGSKRYEPAREAFVPDSSVPVQLGGGNEIGPGIALMDGRVIWFGATGHTSIYTPGGAGQDGLWVRGPDLPTMHDGYQLVANDTSAILEPNGKVFLVAWWGSESTIVFLEYDPAANDFTLVDGSPRTANGQATKMLLLPNGHGLVSISKKAAQDDNGLYDVAFDPGVDAAWRPTITSFPSAVRAGSTVTLAGTQLCGLSECHHFGDDNQQAENYPMVRFIGTSGGVTYGRAHAVSTRSIAPGQAGSVLVDIPSSLDPCAGIRAQLEDLNVGDFPNVREYERAREALMLELRACTQHSEARYGVEVVAMGIPSVPVAVEVIG